MRDVVAPVWHGVTIDATFLSDAGCCAHFCPFRDIVPHSAPVPRYRKRVAPVSHA